MGNTRSQDAIRKNIKNRSLKLETKEKLHQTVLNRCLPNLMMDLHVEVLMIYIQQTKLLDDVTIRDINQQPTTTTKVISLLIDQIKQRDQDTYERFKECLIQAQQANLKIMLEEEEEIVAAEMKEKHQDLRHPERKRRPKTSATNKSNACLLL